VTRGARILLLGPYVLLLVAFFVAPLLLMLAISFSRQSFGQLEWAFTPQHYIHFFTDAYYLSVLADTLWLGVITTALSLLLGYPLAYHLP
jgi:ABC-type spermidine/putrescine transport system permease subunit I